MRIALFLALALSLGACAAPMSSIDPKTVKPRAVAAAPKPVSMPDSWKRRYVPKRFQDGDVKMLASYVRPDVNARLFVWAEQEGATVDVLVAVLIKTTIETQGTAAIDSTVKPPQRAVFLFDPVSGRGGYTVFCPTESGRVMTLDADFPPAHGEEIIKEINDIASQIR